jgi:hypothetical protein
MIVAGFSGVCPCGATIRDGDSIGLVDGACVTDMGEDNDA